MQTQVYKENVVAFVIDEAHLIKKWYVMHVESCYNLPLNLNMIFLHTGETLSGASLLI